ncbi:chromosome (plasmid) partitioning protein ParB [Prevotella intermedia]|uniref:Chromosome (Plasmid) partitioning protein ParB n=2 Tax=Prevotella intermedia TaxID=28131 RepID=A0AAD1BGP1_PREIN|nr:ParB-like protein [Prevotella intermedia 17]BAR95289.1 chromosome (plasmid) partitioning protein ParB [Prevotella intermedia]
MKLINRTMAVHKKYNRNAKTNALGRGLDALISTETVSTQGSSTINEVPIEQIEANPNQPRREFDQIALEELANSIKQLGLVQPITLRQLDESKFQIIAGERRWRASQLAGLTAIPAYIRTIKDENVMELALVENIQREDLNAIEIALAYEHLQEKSGMTQERVAERVGKSRAAVANYLRLLKLPAQVQMALQKKEIDMGHARALLSLNSPSQQIKLFHEIQKNAFSVRKVEELCQQLNNGEDIQTAKKKIAAKSKLPEEFNILKKRLSNFFNTKVQMTYGAKGKGKISIPFASEEELLHIMEVMDRLQK